ncbi:G-protein coupled receptor 55 [Misgurnus anguillicaudatus]|uniref:G-protein coupled receptor 55 n=1 Tax=Misgurnus anguillicaudatus TaxID=75329 RepID=UPI003CCFB414
MCNSSTLANHTAETLKQFERVAYMIVFPMGLIFNITALCIFSRIKHWTDTHIYMLNLLIADLLVIIFLPFRIMETYGLLKINTFCTFLLCTHYSNMYCSIFTITAISAQRFTVLKFPFLAKAEVKKRKTIAASVCVFIWTIITIICAIFHRNLLPDHLESCYDIKFSDKLEKNFIIVLETVGYLIPMVINVLCSTQTIYILVKSVQNVEESEGVKRKTVAAVISANLFTFIFCFTPVHVGLLLQYLSEECSNDALHVFVDVAEWIATTNCCMDSIGYYFLLKRVIRNHPESCT